MLDALDATLNTVDVLAASTHALGMCFCTIRAWWHVAILVASHARCRAAIHKEYIAKVDAKVTKAQMQMLQDGLPLQDGKKLVPEYCDLASLHQAEDRLRIVVTEGRNRDVVSLLEHVGMLPGM